MLDTREQPAQTEHRAKYRLDQRAKSKAETIAAIERALGTGKLWRYPLEDFGEHAIPVLEKWLPRMCGCGQTAVHRWCPEDNHHIVTVDCCRVPACPHEEARSSKRWVERGRQLMKWLPNNTRGAQLKFQLIKAKVKLPNVSITSKDVYGWKFITIGLKGEGHLVHDLNENIDLRKRLMRFLTRRFNTIAGFVVPEVGPQGHVHLHCLVYAPFIPRPELQHWLQSQDCTVPGCKHNPDDRSCGGSWVVDIRKATSPHDALKYACSPDPKGQNRDDHAELRLAAYLALYKRHRIETYGLAKPGFWKNVDIVDVVLERNFCPYCGAKMELVCKAILNSGVYFWNPRPPPRSPVDSKKSSLTF